MSDHMFLLESHLTPSQLRVLAHMQAAAAGLTLNLFLTGGAVRDLFAGSPIREMEFTVEGDAIELAKRAAEANEGEFRVLDEDRKIAGVIFPGRGSARVVMASTEQSVEAGTRPQVARATIHEHLRQRDFTINALALSLHRGSRGLLIDPTNGISDIQQRELRAVSSYGFHDHPIRLFRLLRYRVRLGFAVAERTQRQYANAREARVENRIAPADLMEELRQLALEPSIGEVLEIWEQEGLLHLISPALTGPKLNMQGFAKLQKALQALPFGIDIPVDRTALLFETLAEKLTAKERAALVETLGMDKATADSWQKLDARAAKLEKEIGVPKLSKPSALYQLLVGAPAEQALLLLAKSPQKSVQERIRNYFTKYLPLASEVTDADVIEAGGKPGTPKFQKMKADIIRKRLDARPKKPELPPVPAADAAPDTAAPAASQRPRPSGLSSSHRP